MTSPTPDMPVLIDALRDAVLVTRDGLVEIMNHVAETVFQVPRDRAIGRPVIEVLRNHRLEQLLENGGTLELEINGRLWAARAVAGGLILEDLTDGRRRERELREVMAVLSHEFRTPVTAVKGLLEALQTDPPAETRTRFLELSLAEVDRLVRLAEDLTVGFRPQAERTFPLSDVIERARKLLADEQAKRDVRIEAVNTAPLIRCDPDKLLQVLLNLLENAIRHGPNPGSVRVIAQAEDDGFVRVTVHDSGQPLTEYESLFAAHRRGAASRGSGMGLFIVRSIVQAWGGTAWGKAGENGNEFGFIVPGPNARLNPNQASAGGTQHA